MISELTKATANDVEQLASVFRILGDKTRIEIIRTLIEREKNVTEICTALGVPQTTTSHHLSLLRMSNLVRHRRDGKQVYYRLNGHEHKNSGRLVLNVHHMAIEIGG